MKNVAVTGADGFIGSHLVEQLLSEGYKVKALAQYNSFGNKGWLEQIEEDRANLNVCLGDVRDRSFVNEFVGSSDTVFHLAALIGIPYSYKAPQSYVDVNISGTLNVLEACKQSNTVEKLVCTSTSETYGTAKTVPINENHPLCAQSPYAATKIAADQLALSYYRSFNTPVTILRPFNTYGPRQSLRAVIPTIISQIIMKGEVKLGSLTPTRDFSFVTDTARAFMAVAQSSKTTGKIYNSASGFEVSIKKTVELIGEIMNKEYKIVEDIERLRPSTSEVERLFGDAGALTKDSGWLPVYGAQEGFTKGLALTCEWFSDSKNLNMYDCDMGFSV